MVTARSYLARQCQDGDRLLLGVLAALTLMSFALAPWYGTWTEAMVIGLPAFGVTAWLVATNAGALVTRCSIAVALMVFTSLHIHQAHGLIEMHFGVFVLLAFLLVYRDWVPLVVAAATIAVHHLAFDFAQRQGSSIWVFAENTGYYIVLVHAAYVVFETALLVWISVKMRSESLAVGCDPRELSRVAHELAKGNVEVQIEAEGAAPDSLARAMTTMRDELHSTVRNTGEVLHGIATGDLSKRVSVNASGEFARLKNHVNQTAEFLSSFTRNQQHLIERANAGDFSGRAETLGLAGYQLELAQGMNQLVSSMDAFVDRFADVLGGLARGDLTRQISEPFAGRLEELRRDTNATAQQLAQIVNRIRESADVIDQASKEIARGNLDLSNRTEEQASSLQQTAHSTEQLTETVRRNADNARLANELSQSASTVAQRGGTVVSDVVSTMAGISESSKKIADIIGVIQEIAFQTNLLALNAAVEAARAGEQGRGFAVVASEVRALAGRSATAAKEIKELISVSVERVEKGSELVTHAGATMSEIVGSIQKVANVVGDISQRSHSQSAGLEAVNRAIATMDESTQQNAAMVEEAAAAANTLASQARALTESVQVFKLQAAHRAATENVSPGNARRAARR